MVAQVATRQQIPWITLNRETSRLVQRGLACATLVSLLVITGLFVRRLTGEFQRPLTGPLLVSAALVAIGAVAALRMSWRQCGLVRLSWSNWASLFWALPSVTLLCLGLTLSLPGTNAISLLLFWSLLVAGDAIWWLTSLRNVSWRPLAGRSPTAAGSEAGRETDVMPSIEADSLAQDLTVEDDESEELLPTGVTQQVTRSQNADGLETVEGLLRQFFNRAERSCSTHVSFCPPLQHRPSVEVMQVTGPQARIKAAEVHPYGIRFDLRLASASNQQQEIIIHFEARERTSS